jgi:hypothetical protein
VGNEHLEHANGVRFEHTCWTGVEGIVSKRKGSSYRSDALAGLVKGKEP